MKKKLITSLRNRTEFEIDPRNPLKFLQDYDVDDYIDIVIATMYLYTRPKRNTTKTSIYMSEVISAVGHSLRGHFKLKKDSSLAAKAGAFIMYSFEQLQILQVVLTSGNNGHGCYAVEILDDEALSKLWNNLPSRTIEKIPSEVPYSPWKTSKHQNGSFLVKTGNAEVLSKLNADKYPAIFNCVNKAQEVGWRVNQDIFKIHQWAFRNKTAAFADIWEITNPEAKATKSREVAAIGGIAKKFLDKVFYHLYYYDFRGRKYAATAYLHEQGTDLAKGLLLLDQKKPMTKDGFFWLLISIASNWAGDAGREDKAKTDKIPLEDRFLWASDNEEIFLSYAEKPKVHDGWMKADKPWQFLAACIELKKMRDWQFVHGDPKEPFEDYNYMTGIQVYIDGSNNGSQHLSALTKDEITAPLVNLVPQDLPGDLYRYIADHVWGRLNSLVSKLSPEELAAANNYIDDLIELKKKIARAVVGSEERDSLVANIRKFKNVNVKAAHDSCAVYWARITDLKEQRKIVKRNVMTLPYGGTPYGLGLIGSV